MLVYCVILSKISVHVISLQMSTQSHSKAVLQQFSAHSLCSASILVTKGQRKGEKMGIEGRYLKLDLRYQVILWSVR